MDIWDVFQKEANIEKQKEVSAFIVGLQAAGKSSLINRYLDQQGSSKPTIGLDYLYTKKGDTLCNIWEGGSNLDSNVLEIIKIPFSYCKHRTVFCLVLDLSKLYALHAMCSTFLKYHGVHFKKSEVLIICNKYEAFSSLPNDVKKTVNTYLRVIAKSLNANLIQVSTQSETTIMKFKKLMNKLIFQTQTSTHNELDINKNMIIVKDSWEEIGIKSKDRAKTDLNSVIKQEMIDSRKEKEDWDVEKFVESKIDAALKQYESYAKFKSEMTV